MRVVERSALAEVNRRRDQAGVVGHDEIGERAGDLCALARTPRRMGDDRL